jgi:hypothetical protein
MKPIKNIFKIIFCVLPVLFSSCVFLMEKTGQMLDGSAFAQRRTALYRTAQRNGTETDMEISVVENRDGGQFVVIAINKFPMMKLRGSLPDDEGIFNLLSLEYLSSGVHGWNEFTLELWGEGHLILGDTAVLEIGGEIASVQITAGRIHLYDTRITGGEALTSLRGRRERIIALVEWMASREDLSGQTAEDFEKYWKPVLFPEIVSARKRPAGWKQDGDEFVRAEDIRWNTGYTERIFPEELFPVRNSGTLLRDWEEALSWIYLEYEWENITELLSRRNTFHKIK